MFAALAASPAAPVRAQSMSPLSEEQKAALPSHPYAQPQPGGGYGYNRPDEPVFEKITFLKLEPPRTLSERVDALIQGMYVDIPPEYDHYGYEVRRYMAAVAGPEILGSPEKLKEQIKNTKRAEIVLKYWRQDVQEEISAIEAEIEQSNAPSSIRSSFKYHRGVAEAFFVEAGNWIYQNRAMLKYLQEIGPGAYELDEYSLSFSSQKDLQKFAGLYKAREAALERIQDYTPFRMMVY